MEMRKSTIPSDFEHHDNKWKYWFTIYCLSFTLFGFLLVPLAFIFNAPPNVFLGPLFMGLSGIAFTVLGFAVDPQWIKFNKNEVMVGYGFGRTKRRFYTTVLSIKALKNGRIWIQWSRKDRSNRLDGITLDEESQARLVSYWQSANKKRVR